ncbi:MAG TPA: biotin-dependent carboxyltransferase family protein [Candidatus Acidoferrum sp.]|nr:biotin-dependent carboxyltransferase family protein [Candidatus Acidoferrum sp.]
MSAIEVLSPGLLTTVQDLGREGFGPMGVSPSGAADPIALRIGNRLVGNSEGASGLEMTLLGGAFRFQGTCVAALTGSDFSGSLDGAAVPPWNSFGVEPGQMLKLGPTRSGARCYLCVRGGIDVKLFLGSASTHLLSGLGGNEGRALRKGDVLKIADALEASQKGTGKSACSAEKALDSNRVRKVAPRVLERLEPRKVLRVTPGPQSDWFPKGAQKVFYGSTYRVTEEANRMGLRLEGPPLTEGALGEMISEGVSLGAIQIAAGGLPIILFVEQQTTGGYAKIANVISADLPSLGQLRPRDEIRLQLVDFETARKLLIDQEKLLASENLIVET